MFGMQDTSPDVSTMPKPPLSKSDTKLVTQKTNEWIAFIGLGAECESAHGPFEGGDAVFATKAAMLDMSAALLQSSELRSSAAQSMSVLLENYPDSCYADAAQTYVETMKLDVQSISSSCFP